MNSEPSIKNLHSPKDLNLELMLRVDSFIHSLYMLFKEAILECNFENNAEHLSQSDLNLEKEITLDDVLSLDPAKSNALETLSRESSPIPLQCVSLQGKVATESPVSQSFQHSQNTWTTLNHLIAKEEKALVVLKKQASLLQNTIDKTDNDLQFDFTMIQKTYEVFLQQKIEVEPLLKKISPPSYVESLMHNFNSILQYMLPNGNKLAQFFKEHGRVNLHDVLKIKDILTGYEKLAQEVFNNAMFSKETDSRPILNKFFHDAHQLYEQTKLFSEKLTQTKNQKKHLIDLNAQVEGRVEYLTHLQDLQNHFDPLKHPHEFNATGCHKSLLAFQHSPAFLNITDIFANEDKENGKQMLFSHPQNASNMPLSSEIVPLETTGLSAQQQIFHEVPF